jgi:hypothetical protein
MLDCMKTAAQINADTTGYAEALNYRGMVAGEAYESLYLENIRLRQEIERLKLKLSKRKKMP